MQAADAEDVFQAVFQAVAGNLGRFRKDRPTDSFRGWLRVIVRSKLTDHLRRRGVEPQAVGGSDARQQWEELAADTHQEAGDPREQQECAALRGRALEMVRAEFEPRTWQMFWRVVVEGQAVKDVADDLGITPSAVRLAKSRVLSRLKEEMKGLEP